MGFVLCNVIKHINLHTNWKRCPRAGKLHRYRQKIPHAERNYYAFDVAAGRCLLLAIDGDRFDGLRLDRGGTKPALGVASAMKGRIPA
jgi:hypothetical protein